MIKTKILLLALIFTCCNERSRHTRIKSVDGALTFYVVGDWGRNGQAHQREVAQAMNDCGELLEPDFVVSTGDNFYQNGVASVDDPLWTNSFENVYTGEHLMDFWYPVLGNHDYRGNVQAQIDYSKKSQRWKMLSRYYVVDKVLKNGIDSVKLIFIDSNPFEDKYYKDVEYKNVWTQDSTTQLHWIDSVLRQSKARWNIVFGHHPMYTVGKRINEKNSIRAHLEKILTHDHKVAAYFAGHEHDLQHHLAKGNLHHFVSGAGSEIRPVAEPLPSTKFAQSIPGFMSVSITHSQIIVQVINADGKNLHTAYINHD